ncbi:MAG: SH3 domain-containing protein [Candidatus Paracaedibacteraceae bacterium]|nr:SH3 domain-containing protein [Candidatus Paracaedibacteraceae bacterium]
MIEKIQHMTQNACYLWNKKNNISIIPSMIIIHSTATKGVMADEWFKRWNNSWTKKGVHAFIDNKQRCVTLPYNMWAWGVGGKANGYSLQMEICEDKDCSEEYFRATVANAVKTAAEWCIKFKIPVHRVIGHYEAYKMGIGSNHGDPSHWFPKFSYSMDMFRSDVQKEIGRIISPHEEKVMDRQFTIANLNVRYGPGTNFKILKVAPKGTYLEIFDASGGWAKVRYDGVTGYVSTKYLQNTISGYVTASVLNVRAGRGTEYQVVTQIQKGAKVTLMSLENGWYEIPKGYISADWISLKKQ